MDLPWGAAAIAFLIATGLTLTEFCTSKYPNTAFLILRSSRALWIYCVVYGVIAFAGFWLSNQLIASSILTIQGFYLQNPYVRAVVLGFASKAIMQLNIYTVTTGATSFPLGFQTVVQLFEPYLVRLIGLDEFNAVKAFIAPYTLKFPALPGVKAKIKENIPPFFTQQERAAFENELDKDQYVHEAMERFLRFLGRKTFRRVFGS